MDWYIYLGALFPLIIYVLLRCQIVFLPNSILNVGIKESDEWIDMLKLALTNLVESNLLID